MDRLPGRPDPHRSLGATRPVRSPTPMRSAGADVCDARICEERQTGFGQIERHAERACEASAISRRRARTNPERDSQPFPERTPGAWAGGSSAARSCAAASRDPSQSAKQQRESREMDQDRGERTADLFGKARAREERGQGLLA
jgi:hypothetical protein